MSYGRGFYDTINEGSLRSARAIVPTVKKLTGATDVVDVGCGEGAWAKVFEENGCFVMGVDGAHVDMNHLMIDKDHFWPMDLMHERVVLGRQFDLAVSLEVAEHLSDRRAQTFVEDLCALAPIVLFSAAIPGQGGTNHFNEQPPRYWASLFEDQGFRFSMALRWRWWDDPDVENWYRQNLALCARADVAEKMPEIFDTVLAHPFHVVHPILFDARRR